MSVKIEDVSSIKKKLTIEVAVEQVNKAISKAYKKIGKTAKVKGFRAGKVPESVLEKYYGAQMEQDVLTSLINDTYFKALQENDILAIGEPSIVESSGINKCEAFTYEAEVEIKPEVTAKDYTKLSLEKEKFVADPKAVSGQLEEMRTSKAQLEVTEREEARNGDSVVIDFEGFIDDEAFDGGKGEDHVLELGSGSFIPGFEDQVVGMKREENKSVEVSFPADYGQAELAGKPAVFKVFMKEIKEKVVPELDDEFAKGFGVDTLDELKEQLQTSYETQETSKIENELREKLVGTLIERNPIEVPEAMIAKQLDYMYENISNRMKSQGMSPERLGITPESFRENYRTTAIEQVSGNLILEAIGRQENIVAEESEIDAKLEEIATMANAPIDTVKKYYAGSEARSGLMAQIAEEKVVGFLLESANVKEVTPKKPEEATEKKAAKKVTKKTEKENA
ncbi:MAG: trigger factor [Candidatus Marinimicrobia bacterium]|nr:trigger factor [Candidatus Neomarinimicrobiota bacterium]